MQPDKRKYETNVQIKVASFIVISADVKGAIFFRKSTKYTFASKYCL